MSPAEILLFSARTAVTAAMILGLAAAGGLAARRLGQPEVIGEIATGLLAGLALARLAGPATTHQLLPPAVLDGLKQLADGGLILFVVGVAHTMWLDAADVPDRRAVGWVAAGSFVPPLCLGAALGSWLLYFGGPDLRGTAPGPAFVLFVAVSLAITAVPVLARILAEREPARTRSGRIALAAAIVQDTAGWLVLSVALGLSSGSFTVALRSATVLAGGVLVALALRWVLRTGVAGGFAVRHRLLATGAIAVVAIAVAVSVSRLGLTSILGAALVGLAIPDRWRTAVAGVSRIGRWLVPLFFAVTGLTIFLSPFRMAPWTLVLLVLGLAVFGKVGGGYLGARLGGHDRGTSVRIGTLMNTRGLTELVVLQVGYHAGILPGALFLTFVIMALITTAMIGPALLVLDRVYGPGPQPAAAQATDPH